MVVTRTSCTPDRKEMKTMASRTFGTYKRGSVTINDYFNWRDHSPAPACANSTNPAFLSGLADPDDIMAAMDTCKSCPLLKGCEFFASTKHFRDFDGVMGGRLFLNSLDDEVFENEVMADNENFIEKISA